MGYMGDGLYATEVTSPRNGAMFGISTSVADRDMATVLYANEFASPERE